MSQRPTAVDTMMQPTTKVAVAPRKVILRGERNVHCDSSTGIRRPFMNIDGLAKPLILHIDDDVDLVDALTTRLVASSFRVESAFDGEGGLQLACNRPVNAIILDYDLPGDRGDEMISKFKRNSQTQNIPIIVLTAVQQRGLQREMLARGADMFMAKPFEFKELESAVRDLIYGSRDE